MIRQGGTIPWSQLLPLLAIQVTITLGQHMLTPTNYYLNGELGRKLTVTIQIALYDKINSFAGLAYFENPAFYDQIQLAQQGAQSAATKALSNLTTMFQQIITLLSFLGALLAFQPLLAALLLLAVLPNLYAEIKLGRHRVSMMADISPKRRYKSFFGMLLSGHRSAKEVRLFGLGSYFLHRLRSYLQEIHSAERIQQKREMIWQAGLGVLSSVVSSGAYVLVIIAAFSEQLSLGDIMLYIGAITSVQAGLNRLMIVLASMNESALFFTHYDALMGMSSDISMLSPHVSVKPLTTKIELRGVSFRYSDKHPWVLRNVNLLIPAGQCLVLVGLNGAGKTTLVKLLARLYDPTEGEILWDGVDIRQFEVDTLRQHIGVIFQDFMRYDLTVQENIGLGDVAHIDNLPRVRKAARQAGIHEAIEATPNGYETPLGFLFTDRGYGVDMSGGQWQKLATARLFMRQRADLLILDEPTAALDAQAEYEMYSHFAELVAGRTSVLISHRFSTVRMADKIAVLEGGEITEHGAHDELLSLGGIYAKLYRMQAEKYSV